VSYLPLRLPPGEDLRHALEATAPGSGSFVVSGIGSLWHPRLRFAAAEAETQLKGPFEILTLSGSITAEGAHLHIAVADGQGQVIGGHLCYGSRVRTTAEILTVRPEGWQLRRLHDATTGYLELQVQGLSGKACRPSVQAANAQAVDRTPASEADAAAGGTMGSA
jgi:predicted DNA-binding protein with PD1-like motif